MASQIALAPPRDHRFVQTVPESDDDCASLGLEPPFAFLRRLPRIVHRAAVVEADVMTVTKRAIKRFSGVPAGSSPRWERVSGGTPLFAFYSII